MKRFAMQKGMALLGALLILGLAAQTFAGRGMGMRGGDCRGEGMGRGMGHGMGWMADLSAEQLEKVKAERDAFRKATAELRQSIRQKHLELAAELAKPAPEAGKAQGLQREISGLEAQQDQKEIAHALAIRKIAPDAPLGLRGHGPMGRHCGGRGHGMGSGMGMLDGDCPRLAGGAPTTEAVN
jgi:Spy/CpxP family protein refolding chaperone